MYKYINYFVIIYILLIFNSVDSISSELQTYNQIVLVNTNSGPINGVRDTFDGKEIDVYLGIPYAEPPINDLRFRKPLPVKRWTQPLDANQWPNNCYQILSTFELKNFNFSEDCLYLNIWTANTEQESHHDLRPVIIFIYGGSLYYGSSTQDIYDAKVLSSKGDLVVVTLNYRLDAFGFLYADSDEAPGNVGLWDQLMAIKWVNENIQHFGGDPDSITLMGWSAGAWSVSLHLMSKQSNHLFKNAILMSGAVYNHVSDREASKMKQNWLNAAVSIGCAQEGEGHEEEEYSYIDFTPKIMKCLRSLSPKKVLQLCTEAELSAPKMGWFRLVVIDGQFLTGKPTELLETNLFNTRKNVLIGTVEDEGSFHLNLFYDTDDKYDMRSPKNFTLEEAFDELVLFSSNLPTDLEIIGEEVSELYLYGLSDQSDSDEIRSRISSALGDFYITCPTIRFAESLFRSNANKINVYQYYYTNRLGDTSCSSWMRACHSSDIYSVFGIPLKRSEFTSTKEKDISIQMIELFSHFAKFGYPKSQNGIEFSSYYIISDKVLKPYYEISENPKPITNFGINLKTIECEYLWNEYLDV